MRMEPTAAHPTAVKVVKHGLKRGRSPEKVRILAVLVELRGWKRDCAASLARGLK